MSDTPISPRPLSSSEKLLKEKFAESIHPAIRGKLVPEAMFDRVLKLLEEYRSSQKSN